MQTVTITQSKTRPANTTAYAANDVISENASTGTAWSFSGQGRSGLITGATLVTNKQSVTAAFTLFLFRATPTGVLNDNAANTSPVFAEASDYIGHIDFDAAESLGSSSSWTLASPGTGGNLPLPFFTPSNDTIYGVLVTRDVFTPDSGQQFSITLTVERD